MTSRFVVTGVPSVFKLLLDCVFQDVWAGILITTVVKFRVDNCPPLRNYLSILSGFLSIEPPTSGRIRSEARKFEFEEVLKMTYQ